MHSIFYFSRNKVHFSFSEDAKILESIDDFLVSEPKKRKVLKVGGSKIENSDVNNVNKNSESRMRDDEKNIATEDQMIQMLNSHKNEDEEESDWNGDNFGGANSKNSTNRNNRNFRNQNNSHSNPRRDEDYELSVGDENDQIKMDLPEHLHHLEISELNMKSIKELRLLAHEYKIDTNGAIQKQHLINAIIKKAVFIPQVTITCDGVLEVLEENGGFGFLRSSKVNYVQSNNDVYVPNHFIKKFNLDTGHSILCTIKQPNSKKNERYYPIDRILKINGRDILVPGVLEDIKERRHFDELIPCYPDSRYRLENTSASEQDNITNRMIDLMSPIGKGQRALIVAPPRTGKTVLLKNIANSISMQYPKVKLFMLLIDERPEEVTDMIRSIKGEVISSTFDESAENHIHVAEMVLEKAKRLVEMGDDVVVILDSITRLARAYNTMAPSSGKVLTGGIDSGALQRPKRWFGAARNIDGGGSLTIIGSALVETGSRMDEVIFEEFKGTGNCEIVLDRRVAEKRIFPAFDILKSGTRKEELLLSPNELQRIWLLRRVLSSLNPNEAIELLREKITSTKTNDEFLASLGANSNK
jgi:transcription termination factor Rho